ncbi:hypothetical protein MTP99_006075 [Tenebrio molitor]|nr:hypothetical protein MTP99_006075 [Tenebrio molitor]
MENEQSYTDDRRMQGGRGTSDYLRNNGASPIAHCDQKPPRRIRPRFDLDSGTKGRPRRRDRGKNPEPPVSGIRGRPGRALRQLPNIFHPDASLPPAINHSYGR